VALRRYIKKDIKGDKVIGGSEAEKCRSMEKE